MPVITAIYGHCDVLQGTEGAPQRPQISRSVDKKSPHGMIGKSFALKNVPTLSLSIISKVNAIFSSNDTLKPAKGGGCALK